MNALSPANWAPALSAWAVNTSLAATVLIGLALLVQWFFDRRLPVRWGYALWLLVVVRLLLPAVPASSFSIFNLRKGWEAAFPKPPPAKLAFAETPRAASPASGGSPLVVSTSRRTDPQLPAEAAPAPLPHSSTAQRSRWLWSCAPYLWLAGALGYFAAVLLQHHKLARWIKRQEPLRDPRVLAVLAGARAALGLRCPIRIVAMSRPSAPAIFGLFRPRLLLPRVMLEQFGTDELRLIFLHELAHVKRRDVLLNWLLIVVRSLHWFNPAVWLALRRLRAERELVCDALVMARLAAGERQAYGGALLKVVEHVAGPLLHPALLPIFHHRSEIHRRITMITQFKPTPWFVTMAAAILVLALGGFTFTRAAEKRNGSTASPASPADRAAPLRPGDWVTVNFYDSSGTRFPEYKARIQENGTLVLPLNATVSAAGKTLEQLEEDIPKAYGPERVRWTASCKKELPAKARDESGSKPLSDADAQARRALQAKSLKVLEAHLEELNKQVQAEQKRLDALRTELGIPSHIAEGNGSTVSQDAEVLRQLELLRIQAMAEYRRINSLQQHLAELNRNELKRAVATACPDPQLEALMKQQAIAEQKLADLVESYAPQHPEVKRVTRVLAQIGKQVEDRVDGILAGLKAKAESEQARLDAITKSLKAAKASDLDAPTRYRPYFQAKRDLETLLTARERLKLRILQETIDQDLSWSL